MKLKSKMLSSQMGRTASVAVLLMGIGFEASAAPEVSAITVSPSTISPSTATVVTVTASIPDATLLTQSVNLIRVNASGPVVAGTLKDDGTGGDATLGDKVFTGRITLTEASGLVTLRVSAAFRGMLRRVLSPFGTVTVGVPGGPAITDFNPKSAPAGTLVTVSGANLAPNPQVTLSKQGDGTIAAPVASSSATSLAFTIPTGTATGQILIRVGSNTALSTVPLAIVASNDFTVSAAPASTDLIRGQTVSYAVRLATSSSFRQLAALSVSGLPAGVTALFKPQQITAGQTSVLTLSAPVGQALGAANLTITAAATVDGIRLTKTAGASVNVVAPTTSFIGRTVVDDALQTPLAGVTVTMLGKNGSGGNTGCTGTTVADAAGNFALRNLAASCVGAQLVGFDGLTATSPAGKYAGVNLVYTLVSGQVTVSPVLVHLPRIDDKETFLVQQNSASDQSYSYTSIPGLSLTVYRNTTFTMPNGTQPNPFPLVAVQVPVDRLPDAKPPVPTMLQVFIVAFQPANARASQPVAVTYPNTTKPRPGTNMPLMTLDPTRGAMVPYGTGTVTPNGTQVLPDLDPAFPGHRYGIVNFDWHGNMIPPPPPELDRPPEICPIQPPPGSNQCARCARNSTPKPVHYSSGIESFTKTDISFGGGRGAVSIVRQYRSLSNNTGSFGVGSHHNYGYSLDSLNPQSAELVNLITPEWNRIPFSRTGTTLVNDSVMLGAVMTVGGDGRASIRMKDGTVWQFTAPGVAFPLLESMTDTNGNRIVLTRDAGVPARITRVTDPVGRSLTFAYDAQNRITTISDPAGRTVAYAYNSLGALAAVTDLDGGVTTYEYATANRLTRQIDPRGVVVMENIYDAAGRITQQKLGDGGIYRMSYTLFNPTAEASPVQQTIVTDPMGRQTTYRFSPEQDLLDIADSDGQRRLYARKAGSNLIESITGGAGCASCGNAAAGDIGYRYDDATGNVLSQADGLARTTDQRGNATNYTYDSFGQLSEVTDPTGQKTRYAYDSFGNLISITDALGNRTQFRYDALSRQVEVLDPLGRSSRTAYDSLGRVTRQTDAKGGVTQFAYDGAGNLTAVTDARGKRTTFTYDGMGRLLTRTTPLNKTDSRTYDANGNLTRFVDRRGQASTFAYDALDRLVAETYSDATVNRYYDNVGRLVRVEDSQGGVFTFQLDLVGGLVSAAGPFGTVNYTRDELGRVKTRQVVGSVVVTYGYDPAGNMLSASMPQAAVNYSYDARNLPMTMSRQNGVNTTNTYDPVGRLLSIGHSRGSTPVATLNYANDAGGQRISQQTTVGQALITQPSMATYDDGNRLLQRGTSTFSYDDNGNLVYETGSAGATAYTWDGRNRLASLTTPTQTIRSTYDFFGNLLQQAETGALNRTQTYVIDDLTNVAQVDSSAVLTGRSIDGHLAVVQTDPNVEHGLTDAIRSTVLTLDNNGTVQGQFHYEPFGQSMGPSSMYPFRFTGRTQVAASLMYYRARYYSTLLARFISEDPMTSGLRPAANPYAYASNRPNLSTDPTGEWDTNDLWGHGAYCGSVNTFGPAINRTDTCCRVHDLCYEDLGVSAGTANRSDSGVRACNQALLDCVRSVRPCRDETERCANRDIERWLWWRGVR